MSRKFKLLYFVSEDWYFCSHRLPLAVAAREAGFEVVVVTKVYEHGETIRRAGLRVIPFEMSRRGMNPLQELQVLRRLIAIYREEKPDLTHHVAMKPVIYGSLAACFSRTSHVVNAMAGMGWLFTSGNIKARLIKPMVRLLFRVLLSPTRVIVQNQDDAALMAGVGLKSVHLIQGSGVNLAVFRPGLEPSPPPPGGVAGPHALGQGGG